MSGKAAWLSPLIHDVVKRCATWHQFIGAPDFPTYWLYNEDTGFGRSEKVEVHYDSENNVEKVVGKNAALQEASIEFSWNDTTKKSKVVLKKGTTTELTIEEWLSEGTTIKLYIDTKYADNSDYDVQMRITKPLSPATTSFSVEVDINNKTLTGTVDISSESVPQIAKDIVSELNSMNSPATVAALEANILTAVAIDFWKQGSYGTCAWQDTLDVIGTILSDTFGFGVTRLYGKASKYLAEKSKEAS
ncbi:hypothetical protein HQ587_06245 [bacterium]|nr:hypothetical protein [bacterium]